MRKLGGRADALGLEKVAALMSGDDFEAGRDGEAQAGNEGIPEAKAIDVFVLRGKEKAAAVLIAGEKAIEDREGHGRGRLDFRGGRDALSVRRGFDEGAEKPAAEPAGIDFVDGRVGFAFQRGENGREISVGGGAEVIETLADAPGVGSGLPVQLWLGKPGEELFGRVVVGVEDGGEAQGPSWCR